MLLEPVVLELARRGEWAGPRRSRTRRRSARASTRSWRVSRNRRVRPRERAWASAAASSGAASAHPAVLGGDEDAGELAGRVQAEAAGGDAVAVAQDEEGGEPVGRELLERQVDLGLVGGAAEVADGELGEVLARERDRVGAVGRLGADGPHGRDHIRVQRDERGRYSPQRPAGSGRAARARPARRHPPARRLHAHRARGRRGRRVRARRDREVARDARRERRTSRCWRSCPATTARTRR